MIRNRVQLVPRRPQATTRPRAALSRPRRVVTSGSFSVALAPGELLLDVRAKELCPLDLTGQPALQALVDIIDTEELTA